MFNITRRGFLIGGAMALTGNRLIAEPACSLVPEQEEGPYYLDFLRVRKNLTEGRPGVPLQLRINVVDSKRCLPLENTALDIWHCDAVGLYSGFTANGGGDFGRGRPPRGGPGPGGFGRRGGPGLGRDPRDVDSSRFLRGVQFTNKQGVAEFETLYPGWYAGRTTHIHVKVHIGGTIDSDRQTGGHVSHTGQLFFPEDVTEGISKLDPYLQHRQVHRTLNTEDHIFLSQHGAESMVTLSRIGKSDTDGYLATISLAVDPEATPRVF
jgi:protocatechuate 3,4-dioxygenase beta subunit